MKRILMITTSTTQMGVAGKPTGVWAEELAVPYYAFVDAGASVELASPLGGAVPFDAASLKPVGSNPPQVERMLVDPNLQAKLAAAQAVVSAQATMQANPTAALSAAQFDAVFFPGGHGTMWDLPHPAVGKLAGEAFKAGRLVGSVCHGAAGLVSARDANGEPIVKGRRVNSFTDAEETAAGLMGIVPFALETRLRELGARFEGAPNWQPFAVRDGQLITGQNPASSALVANLLVEALGLVPVASAPIKRAA
jgi:putative intracellular protease/amidase